MSDEVEVETKDLQETIEELHKERAEREAEERQTHWTRYIALTTAVLAAFAAVAALQSGSLANEGMFDQLRASDTWAEYQASRQKTHMYTIGAATLLDANVVPASGKAKKQADLVAEAPPQRLREYLDQVAKESTKTTDLNKKATDLEKEAEEMLHKHHRFAYSVALLQVAIALGAVSALTRIKSVWAISMLLGIGGIAYFVVGFLGK